MLSKNELSTKAAFTAADKIFFGHKSTGPYACAVDSSRELIKKHRKGTKKRFASEKTKMQHIRVSFKFP